LSLLVKEIYPAIIGEGIDSGRPGLLIRLSGCNLRCSYCDTQYAFKGGKKQSIRQVVAVARKSGLSKVLLTGGEPLFQEESIGLMKALLKAGHRVLLETNGTVSISKVPRQAHIIMDIKTPDSGEEKSNRYENLKVLKPGDELKFVLTSIKDYAWSKKMVSSLRLDRGFVVNFSAAAGRLDPAKLAKWLVRDKMNVRLNLQFHRILFPSRSRGV
jgi:7-carboxy-7-deazaguanine synthase